MNSEILILGATSDVAQALIERYQNTDTILWLAARRVERLEALQTHIAVAGKATVNLVEFDVNDLESHAAIFSPLAEKVSTVYCFIGYLGDQSKAETNWNEAEKIIQTNFTGPVSILNIFANAFAQLKEGTIVGISSVAGERGRMSNYFYGSAKAGFSTYLDGLRHRLSRQGVHVMTVKPGFMDTQMTADLDLPPALTASPQRAAKQLFTAAQRKKNTVYISPIWRLVMLAIRNIPEFLFKKMSI